MPQTGNPRPWIRKAEQDYRSAVALSRLRTAPVPDIVCFHAQQCAEKYLKALLVRRHAPFPKTHDLLELLTLVLARTPDLSKLQPALRRLRRFAVIVRYPGAGTTKAEARSALRDVRNVRARIRTLLIRP